MATVYDFKTGRKHEASRKIRLADGKSVTSNQVRHRTVSWEEFVEELSKPTVTDETYAEYRAMSRDQQNRIKDVGYFVAGHYRGRKRKKRNLTEVSLIVLDIDFADRDYRVDLELDYGDLEWFVHTTHKHSDDEPRLRLMFPLTRPVTGEEYSAVSRKLAERFDLDAFDDTTFEFSRAMHYPSCSCDARYVFHHNEGKWVDPDKILAEYDNWRDVTEWPTSSRQSRAPRTVAAKAEDPTTKAGLIGAFCRAYDIRGALDTFLSGVYSESDAEPDRLTYVEGTTANGAIIYDDGLFLYSHHSTDPCSGLLVNAWDLVRLHKFAEKDATTREDTSPSSRPSHRAMVELAHKDAEVRAELFADLAADFDEFGDSEETREKTSEQIETTKKEHTKARKQIMKRLRVDQNGNIKRTLPNVVSILEDDPVIGGVARYNAFTYDTVLTKDLPDWPVIDPSTGDRWDDRCDVILRYHLASIWNANIGKELIRDAVDYVALRSRFHPVRDYLDSLHWDGTPRIDRLFIDYLGTPDTPYYRQTARKVMTAAVKRIYEPGCKFDYTPILQGKQGLRKSSFVKVLFNNYHTEDLPRFDNTQETIETLRGRWVCEISELVAFSKSKIEDIKSFFTRENDCARLPYRAREQNFPRQCVFFGTINDREFLRDPTGNRRFWPIRVADRLIDTDKLAGERDQLWAEARAAYRNGEALYLPTEVEAEARRHQASAEVNDPIEGLITDYLSRPHNEEFTEADDQAAHKDRICAAQVWCEVQGGERTALAPRRAEQINNVLRNLPYLYDEGRHKFAAPYGQQRGFRVDRDKLQQYCEVDPEETEDDGL